MDQEHTMENIIRKNLKYEDLKQFNRIYYGREDHCELKLNSTTLDRSQNEKLHVAGYCFPAAKEETRPSRIVKIGLIQHSIVLPTDKPVQDQKTAILEKVKRLIETAAIERVNILCLQETWTMPFFLLTNEKDNWAVFAESATDGPSTKLLCELAKKHKMVLVAPILEDDNGVWWNTAVIINEDGKVLGKHRKNHLPSIGGFSEVSFYSPGNSGHPVFDTTYGKIAVNICYGRHHALNWLMFGVNGAEIVFNPAATIAEFGESFWGIEARNAAVANGYFTCSINRVGTEEFCLKSDKNKTVSRTYYGSSYVTAPNGHRTPGLSRTMDGLLIAKVDLNLCRQMKDQWGFNMTARLDLYADELNKLK